MIQLATSRVGALVSTTDLSGRLQGLMRLIFEPSNVRLYISPVGSSTNPMTGLVIWLVSIEAPAPSVIKVTEPSTPTFHPAVRLKPASADGVMNMMMTVRACAPSWKPNDAETRL